MTKNQLVVYLYNRLPQVYRTEDTQLLLKRFIETFVEGGYAPLLEDTVNIMDLLDVDKCPSRFLPNLCYMYGYEYSLELPELFQRRLLKYIVEMYKRKGTKSVVRFIARELTGFDSEIIENKDFDANNIEVTGWDKSFKNYRNFILRLTAPEEDSSLFNKESIVAQIIKNFLPTNSQALVITSYWIKEESDLIRKVEEQELTLNVKDTSTEQLVLGGTNETCYDIIKAEEGNYSLSIEELMDTNSLLNVSNILVTNQLVNYDVIKQSGQPNQLIYL